MANLTLLLGPVGAGKTTFGISKARKDSAMFFNLDEWMTNLFRPDRPQDNLIEWYESRVSRCKNQILDMTEKALSNGINVILEIGLLRKAERKDFYDWCEDRNIHFKIIIFDVERSIRRERVLRRNIEKGPSFSMEVPINFFELASDHWEDIDSNEVSGKDYITIWKNSPYAQIKFQMKTERIC